MAVTIGIGIGAVNTGNNLLYLVLGLFLSLLLVSGTLSDLALWRMRVSRGKAGRLVVGEPTLVALEVSNKKTQIPSFAIELEDLQENQRRAEERCFFLKVDGGQTKRSTYRFTPTKRGRLQLTHMRLTTRYPFGLIEKALRYPRQEEWVVFPKMRQTDTPPLQGRLRGDQYTAPRAGVGAEVYALREHRDGDEARLIHWRRSASLDRLVSRETASDSQQQIAILLDNKETAEPAWALRFEHAIEQAAYLLDWAQTQGVGASVLTRSGASPIQHKNSPPDAALRFLALLTSVPSNSTNAMPEAPRDTQTITVSGRT